MTLPPLIRKPAKRDGRLRSAKHRNFVRRHRCCVRDCTGMPTQFAHVRLGTDGGTAMKPSDIWGVSLCVWHHQTLHAGGEASFETAYGLDLKKLALEFAEHSPDPAVRQAAKAAGVREME